MNNMIAGARVATRLIYKAYLPAVLLLVAVILLSGLSDLPADTWIKDPASVADMHPLTGFVTHIGILIWCTTMAICFFSAYLLRRRDQVEEARFLLWGGLLTGYLMFDDLFLMHEKLSSGLGIRELYIYTGLGLTTLAFLWRFRKSILNEVWGPLFLAFALLGASVVVDVWQTRFETRLGQWYVFFEDGFKFVGIAAWCGYFVDRAAGKLAPTK